MTKEPSTAQSVEIQDARTPMAAPTPAMLLSIAVEKGTDLDQLEKLMDLQERYENKEANKVFSAAMTDAQSQMTSISQDASNSQTHSKYATYKALDAATRPIYTANGFSLSFDTGDMIEDNIIMVIATVKHSAGHEETYKMPVPCDGKGAKGNDVMTKTHAVMSALSYGKRGLLKMIFNLAEGESDDDGNLAGTAAITKEQCDALEARLEACGADKKAFCKHMKVDAITKILSSQFGAADAALTKKEGQAE